MDEVITDQSTVTINMPIEEVKQELPLDAEPIVGQDINNPEGIDTTVIGHREPDGTVVITNIQQTPTQVPTDEAKIEHPSFGEGIQLRTGIPEIDVIKEQPPKHPGGRPCRACQYKDDILAKFDSYLERCKKGVNGKPLMPYKEELAMELDTIDETLNEWAKKKNEAGELEHPEFSAKWSMLNMIQKWRLQQRTLGRYNPSGAIALLKWHHGMMETSKQILAGDSNEPLEIIITEDKPKNE